MPMSIRRRAAATGAIVLSAALALTGCSAGGSAASSDEPVTLRLTWWGDDVRAEATQKAIDEFEAENPTITVEAEPLPFDGYFDKLSTQVAANDAPDVQQLTLDYVAEYGSRGAMLDLADVDTSGLDAGTTESAQVDGEQWGVPTGLATQIVVANKTLFDAAGVPLPDDTTWTWDDYISIASQISAASPDGVYGAAPLGMDAPSFFSFLRQEGAAPYDEDGKVAFDADDVEAYLDLAKELQTSGGSAGPEVAAEQVALPLEQTGTATNTFGMGFWASGQYTALLNNSQQELVPLRIPALKPGDAQMLAGASQYWSANSRTKNPEAAQKLIDFLVNDEEAGMALGLVRGTPPNASVAEALSPSLSESDATITDLVTEISPDSVAMPLPPAGFGTFQDVFRRYVAEFMFGRQSAEDAAQGLVDETTAMVG